MSEIPLNKFEKIALVRKLLNEGKTYREICHLAHVSSRDIKPIAKELERKKRLQQNKENNQESTTKKLSLSSRAFILFQEGKKLDEVKVVLDIPFKLAIRYWKQYLKSIRMFESYEFYQEHSYDMPTFLSIATFIKRNNVFGNNIVNVLRTANNILSLNQTYSNLKAEIEKMKQIKKRYSFQILPPLQPLPRHPSSWNGYYY